MVKRILGLMGASTGFDMRGDESNEISSHSLNAESAHRELGWQLLFTLDEGLERTIAWYRTLRAQSND